MPYLLQGQTTLPCSDTAHTPSEELLPTVTTFNQIDLTPAIIGSTLVHDGQQKAHANAQTRVLTYATTDSEIAKEYLYYADLAPASLANTQKELYRFLLWCELEAGLSIKNLMPSDLEAYKTFLTAPPSHWVNTRKLPRSDPEYRPFSGPLSNASRRQALVAVKSFLSFATDRRYLELNIGALVKNVKKQTSLMPTRYLSEPEINLAIAAVDGRICNTAGQVLRRERDRFLLIAYYYTGARLSELVNADMDDFKVVNDDWCISVIGKGNKPRNLTVHPDLLAAYSRYRVAYNLPPSPTQSESVPLVLSCRGKELRRITNESASDAIKNIFQDAIQLAITTNAPVSIQSFLDATTHWLRHSMLSHNANNGVQVKTLQDAAGHANISITSVYLHKAESDRHAELNAAKDLQNERLKSSA